MSVNRLNATARPISYTFPVAVRTERPTLEVRASARHDLDRGVMWVWREKLREVRCLCAVQSHIREPREDIVDGAHKLRISA